MAKPDTRRTDSGEGVIPGVPTLLPRGPVPKLYNACLYFPTG